MTRPRNPRYFPKMKVRGARRRRLAPAQRATRAFDHLSIEAIKASRHLTAMYRILNGKDPS